MKSTRTTPRHHRYEGPRIERPTPTSPPSVQGIWPKADILVMEKWMTMAHQSRWLNHLPTYINTVPIKTGWLVQYPFWRAKQSNITFFQGCFILYEVGKFQVSGLIIRRYMFLSQTTHFFISGKCHCPKKNKNKHTSISRGKDAVWFREVQRWFGLATGHWQDNPTPCAKYIASIAGTFLWAFIRDFIFLGNIWFRNEMQYDVIICNCHW